MHVEHLCCQIHRALPRRRKVYDQTGDLTDAEELTGESFDDLYKYYRDLYKEVTEADIDRFASQFRGSDEEAAEVLQYYERFKGDMHQVQSSILCPRYVSAHSLRGILLIKHVDLNACLLCRCLNGSCAQRQRQMHIDSEPSSMQLLMTKR